MENFDYEKAYKAVLQTAKQWIKDGCTDKEKICLESVFPELRESEDERIRAVLLKLVLGMREEIFTTADKLVTKPKVLAYLEKQKESNRSISWTGEMLEGKLEQKPVGWSDEDEKRLDAVCELLENTSAIHPNYSHKKLIIWLKSFRPQRSCSDCSKHLEGYISGRGDSENKLLDQFGALITPEGELHMKPRWKPSDENIHAIGLAIANLNPIGHYSLCDELNELRDNLLKLK